MSKPFQDGTKSTVRHEAAGWIYYDELGKDYGPYQTKEKALAAGPEAAKREAKLLARPTPQ